MDPSYSRICEFALASFYLTAQDRLRLRGEFYRQGASYDQFSDFAKSAYDVAKTKLSKPPATGMQIDASEKNRLWSVTPDTIGVTSKAGLMAYLGQIKMTLEDFYKTPMYRLNKEFWDELNV